MLLHEERDPICMYSKRSLHFFQNPHLIHTTPWVANVTLTLKFPFLGVGCCLSVFGIFINDWRFTDRYIGALRWLACFGLPFILSLVKSREVSRHTFCSQKENITNFQFLFISFQYKVPKRYETGLYCWYNRC
jgi:hypothetical protein